MGMREGALRLLRSGDNGIGLAVVLRQPRAAHRSTPPLGGCNGDRLGMACGSHYESTRAHIDESRRSRVMASGNWPVKFCPLTSLQECALTVGCTGSKR